MTSRLFTVLLLGICLLPGLIAAQTKESAVVQVIYEMKHIQDLDRPDRIHQEEMLLMAGPKAALFSSNDRIQQSISAYRQMEEMIAADRSTLPMIRLSNQKAVTPIDYFFFLDQQKFFVVENLVINYLYEEKFPSIAWELASDVRSIQGIPCQKAVGHFKGRDWTVWFAESIGLPFGPWELGGLPGLILEAEDATGEVIFSFSSLETVNPVVDPQDETLALETKGKYDRAIDDKRYSESPWIALPMAKVKRANKKDLLKLKEAAVKNTRQFVLMQMEAGDGFIQDAGISTTSWTRQIKNPIALKD